MGLLYRRPYYSGQWLADSLSKTINSYQHTKFKRSISISFWDRKGVPKFNGGLLAPCRTTAVRWKLCVTQVLARSNCLYSLRKLCEYVFSIGLPFICTQKWFFGGLRVKMWKYCVLTPKRHYPAWIRVCWCIACRNWFNGLSARSVEVFCVQRRKK